MLISLTLGITGFLCVLNGFFAAMFRKRHIREMLSYLVAGLLELAIFGVALALRFGILTTIPYHLPPGLPFNRAEIGAALAVGIGLLPAAYWHRTSATRLRVRIAEDAKIIKEHNGDVRVRNNPSEDWMN
jgi:hypothetical protein